MVGPVITGPTPTQHDYHHDMKVKPEAATAVIELLMMGGKTPETCWVVNKRQDNRLENCCIWLVIYLNSTRHVWRQSCCKVMVLCGVVQLNLIVNNPLRRVFVQTGDRTPACGVYVLGSCLVVQVLYCIVQIVYMKRSLIASLLILL